MPYCHFTSPLLMIFCVCSKYVSQKAQEKCDGVDWCEFPIEKINTVNNLPSNNLDSREAIQVGSWLVLFRGFNADLSVWCTGAECSKSSSFIKILSRVWIFNPSRPNSVVLYCVIY